MTSGFWLHGQELKSAGLQRCEFGELWERGRRSGDTTHVSAARAGRAYNSAMTNPWLGIPLEDYEGHMREVQQLAALAELFQHALDRRRPESVAVLGVAGGNGLEQIDPSVTKRIVGVDLNQRYLDEVRRRFGTAAGLELHCRDLGEGELDIAPVAMVHAALIFEHAGVGAALENAVSLVAPGGVLSVVLQLPSAEEHGVAPTRYTTMQKLKSDFELIDKDELQRLLRQKGFGLVEEAQRALPAGKALWLGVFARMA